ncbi:MULTISPECIES: hypothetical protein [unclassified Empedobacter]|uniref:hypothetical protein n=1 Tax=unclassified Empedobacter TaxID=2643773 RepID=UPI0025BEB298|nr:MULTISPECIES: hypothetical protein [unclassified Empedobacter]
MKEIYFGHEKKVYFPENLNECNSREYIDICRLAYAFHTKEIDWNQFLSNAVYAILNVKPSNKIRTAAEDLDHWNNIAFLSQFVESFFDIDRETNSVQLINHLGERKITNFRYWVTNYHAPLDGFLKNTYGQWEDAVEIILDHFQYPDEDNMYKVLAIFFLPKNEKYNKETSLKRVEKFKHIDIGIVYGFFLHVTAFMNYLNSASVFISGQEIDLSIIFDNEVNSYESPRPGIGIKATAYMMAESGVFGNYEHVRNSNLWDVLVRMYDVTKKAIDLQDQQKQQPTS